MVKKSQQKMSVPFLKPEVYASDVQRMVRCIESGWFTHGKYTDAFERKLAAHVRAESAVMVASCTAALHISLILAGIKEGDEVITTPLSYVATSNVILYQRAKPVFVDVDPDTGLIDAKKVEEKITKRTKAIMPVHLYGQMADMKKLNAIARKHKLVIVEDAAHAVEARRDGVAPGELGFTACFSFHTAKNLTSGQGGAITVQDKSLVSKIRLLRRDGVTNIGDRRRMLSFGYKYDATDLQAALLTGQMDRLRASHAKRRAVLVRYREGFAGTKIRFPKIVQGATHAGHLFVVWVDSKKRDHIRHELAAAGIETSIHYEPIHLEPYYCETFGFKKGDFPVAERLGASVIALPTYSRLTAREQDYIIEKLRALI